MPHNDILAKLKDAIRSVSDNIQNYVSNPGDFSRNGKLPADVLIEYLIGRVYPKFCVNSKKQCKTRINQERAGSGFIRCPLVCIIACRAGGVKGGAKRRSSQRPKGA